MTAHADPTASRRAQMFPQLTPAQMQRIGALGQQRAVKAGELLFEAGARNTSFFVVVEGALEVVRLVAEGEALVVVHGPGEFTGEINMLSGRRSLVLVRAARDGLVLELDRDHLRALVQRDAEVSEILMRAFILRRAGLIAQEQSGLVLIGSRHSAPTMALREFLTRNAQPFSYQDLDGDPAVQELLDRFHVTTADVPVVVCAAGSVLRNPSIERLARELGLSMDIDEKVHDVVIVGAGPAGLAAAVYAASEGLDVLVLEATAPGGQAGTSSRIENYLGFPTGISGQALAGRAFTQAEKFGANLAIGRRASRLDCDSKPYRVILDDGEAVRTRALVIASGVRYRKPDDIPDLARFEGTGVFYSATHLEAQMCENEHVIIVGGGNSAGQAAVFLAGIAARVQVLVRGPGLSDTMSRYLIQRIADSQKVTVHPRTVIAAMEGGDWLERVRWRQLETGSTETLPVRHVFMMTGADPHTKWLQGCVRLDDKGFIKTGADLHGDDISEGRWPLARPPYLLETTIPGVFAVGDARSGSTKRVASAVGEGAMCVQLVHRVLAEL